VCGGLHSTRHLILYLLVVVVALVSRQSGPHASQQDLKGSERFSSQPTSRPLPHSDWRHDVSERLRVVLQTGHELNKYVGSFTQPLIPPVYAAPTISLAKSFWCTTPSNNYACNTYSSSPSLTVPQNTLILVFVDNGATVAGGYYVFFYLSDLLLLRILHIHYGGLCTDRFIFSQYSNVLALLDILVSDVLSCNQFFWLAEFCLPFLRHND